MKWHAPPACPSAERVAAELADLLGPAFERGGFRSVAARVEPRGEQWQLVLELTDEARVRARTITASDCADLAVAARVAIALALEPASGGGVPSAESDEDRSSEVPLAPASSATVDAGADATREASVSGPPPAESASSHEPSLRPTTIGLHAHAVLDVAALPGAALGISAGAEVSIAPWAVGLYALLLPWRGEAVSASGRAEFALFSGGARGCHRSSVASLIIDACVGMELGQLASRGQGLAEATRHSDLWLAPQGGLRAAFFPGRRWSLQAQGDVLLPLLREAYVVNEIEQVHRPASVGFRAGLGLAMSLD